MRGLRTTALAFVVALLAAGTALAAQPQKVGPKTITAKAFVAVDADTGQVLVAKNAETRMPIASLTKIMTGLLVIERGRLNDRIQIPKWITRVEPMKEYLAPGKRYRRGTLLWSALMTSANDSATALAWDAGGKSLPRFYDVMNARAQGLGMRNTTYASASGLNDETNLSTALDQVTLARTALQNPLFAKIVGTKQRLVRWAAPTNAKLWINHNRMLSSYDGTYGVKTGWTSKAGGCLAVAVERDGRSVVAVVLGSNGIWHDMPLVLERAFATSLR